MLTESLIIASPVIGGYIVGKHTAESVREWYPILKKPHWTPPNWLFGPAWGVLYVLMGIAAARVYGATGAGYALALFYAHLLLNYAWSIVFFEQRDLTKATAVIGALIIAIIALINEFSAVDQLAGKLLWPYLAWTAYATALTLEIRRLNVVA